jgi:hypothetical protein
MSTMKLETDDDLYGDGYYSDDEKQTDIENSGILYDNSDNRKKNVSGSSKNDDSSSSKEDSSNGTSLSVIRMRGMDLDLSLAEPKDQLNSKSYGIQEESVTVVFELPDGSQGENSFKLGHTVEFLKSYVESEYGIPMADQILFLDDRMLLDPFSLLDYNEAKGVNEIFVRVEGILPPSYKK